MASANRVATGTPLVYELKNNYPNPFNPGTMISYSVPEIGRVTLKTYNVIGKELVTLVDGVKNAGSYTARFDGTQMPSGIYLARLSWDGKTLTRKFLLINKYSPAQGHKYLRLKSLLMMVL